MIIEQTMQHHLHQWALLLMSW